MADQKIIKPSLIALVAVILSALLVASAPSSAARVSNSAVLDSDQPLITDIKVSPVKLERNRINQIAVTFDFQDRGKNLQGGLLNINFIYDNGKPRFWTMNLNDSVFKKSKGSYTFYLSVKAERFEWIDLFIWLRDEEGNNGNESEYVRLNVKSKKPQVKQGRKRGNNAYDFSLYNQKGKLVSLSDYKGKVVLLDFCAMWCAPCKDEAAALDALYQKYKDQGLIVLTVVSQNYQSQPPTEKECSDWAALYGLSTPVLADPFFGVYESYTKKKSIDQKKIPYNVIIDRKQVVHWYKYGYTERRHNQIENTIKNLLGN